MTYWMHNVVITCLPKGQNTGIPAAKVATWMTGTFPSIRVGLMVGIGSGVPPKMRLTDIVVSTPDTEYPGVVQWDQGKAEEGGRFQRRGSLNNPPTAFPTALMKLETHHIMYGKKIPQYLEDMEKRYPHLASKYPWSTSLKDPLDQLESSGPLRDGWRIILLTLWRTMFTVLFLLLGWSTFPSEGSCSQSSDEPNSGL